MSDSAIAAEGPVEYWTRIEFKLGDGLWQQLDIGGPTEDGTRSAYKSWSDSGLDLVRNVRLLRREYTLIESC
jgi:hypothetical protein